MTNFYSFSPREQGLFTSKKSRRWRQFIRWQFGPGDRRETLIRYIFRVWRYFTNAENYARSGYGQLKGTGFSIILFEDQVLLEHIVTSVSLSAQISGFLQQN